MGQWDEFCTVCGGPPYVSFETEEDELLPPPSPNPADYTWLEAFIGISNKEEVIPLTDYSGYGSFDTQPHRSPYNYFDLGCRDEDSIDEKTARGYACHVTCYNLLQQELNYTLKYADLLPLLVDNQIAVNKFSWTDYGGLAKYQAQYFPDVELVRDGNLWMIEDPSRNEQNKERILQLWGSLVESGFKRPDATVGDESLAPEIAKLNLHESKA